MAEHRLSYDSPARTWVEALPLGNGRLGAMCFGDPVHDRFALNDDTVWSGSPDSERAGGAVPAPLARVALEEARAAVRAGDLGAADKAVRRLQQRYSQAFLPLGDLRVELVEAGDAWAVRRDLDLATATHTMVAERDGQRIGRTAFTSAADGILLVHTEVHGPPVTMTVGLTSPLRVLGTHLDASGDDGAVVELCVQAPADVAPTHEDVDVPVRYDEDPLASVRGVVTVRLRTDGAVTSDGERLHVHGPTYLTVLLTTATTFLGIGQPPHGDLDDATVAARDRLGRLVGTAVDELHTRHVTDHARLYDRVELDLPSTPPTVAPTTTQRLHAAWSTDGHPFADDPGLGALLFHYGRYLLIASSRPGTLPAHLQGLWNEQLQPPWSSSYTININTQMNYWGAEVTDLGECHEPLFDLVDALARNGAEIAARLYGARGWTAHHNSDAWAFGSPVGLGRGDPAWAFWPMAGLWLVRHHREHLAHGAPREFAERSWPVVRGAVEFALDLLEEIEPGLLGTVVSSSPESEIALPGGGRAGVARASAMDLELIRDAIEGLHELAVQLGREDDSVVREACAALAHLAPVGVAGDGGTAEWFDDPPTLDPTHRHVSMLYDLYPGAGDLTPARLAAAARRLEIRGDEATGWSLAWKTALWARLGRADKVEDLLALMVRDATEDRGPWSGGLYPNMFCAAPPFQVDANLGYVGAIAEALVQSHRGRIVLLPALPAVWSTGSVHGLVVRPGVHVDLSWADGAVTEAGLTSPTDRTLEVEANGTVVRVEVVAGARVRVPLEPAAVRESSTTVDARVRR